ncbi:hypothetical protein [Polyangium spumosum]|uniref:Uncharacterized protein n=1 Tax=Polyangium spumosum TaxID=889282 RepID=A0A6N7Q3W8_9BACT|nr:hypothetical protein [Polyangium spumosum]MRG97906.1 hypothetical protein [Polyangium spumosum]
MRLEKLLHSTFVALTLAAVAALPACSKKEDKIEAEVTAENIAADDAITEQHEAATVTWAVAPEGKVKARFKTPDGQPLDDKVTGTVSVRPARKGAEPVSAKLVFDAKAGVHTADIPKLEDELTEVSYDVQVEGKPLKSTLFVPRGGTHELVATAKLNAEVKIPEGKKGPNGGVLQVAGDDLLEIAADAKTGETRVYVLDDELKPIPVGKRKVKVAVVASAPEYVELAPEPKGLFFTGKLVVKTNPHKLTVVLHPEDASPPVTVLCGWHPGHVVVVGPSAPVVGLFVVANWAPVVVVPTPGVIVVGKGKGKGKWKWKHRGRGPKGGVHIHF